MLIAQGDLGVEIPHEDVPDHQKELVRTCRRWILREPGSGTRSMFEAALRKFGLTMASPPSSNLSGTT